MIVPDPSGHPGPDMRQVKASAGAGKTHDLTCRFLQRLTTAADLQGPFACRPLPAFRPSGQTEDQPPDACAWNEIIALTFTNKAALEMKERILEGLKKRALDLDDLHCPGLVLDQPTALRLLRSILRRLSLLNVRTIDSLFHRLARLSALSLELRPDFEPVFNLGDILDDIFDAFVSKAESGDLVARESLRLAFDSLLRVEDRAGLALAGKLREHLAAILPRVVVEPGRLLSDPDKLDRLMRETTARLRAAVTVMDERLAERGLAAHANFRKALDKCLALGPGDAPPKSAFFDKDSLAGCLLKKSTSNVEPGDEAVFARLKASWREAFQGHIFFGRAKAEAAFVALATIMLPDLEAFQARSGRVLAARLPGYVRDLTGGLVEPSETFCRLGGRLRHLLLDEFQDTSLEQWQALAPLAGEALANGGSLFYVGDVKQAIYAWRGGDARLFESAPEDEALAGLVGPNGLVREILPRNWRSSKDVVEFNNAFFQRLADPAMAARLAEALLPKAADESQRLAMAEAVVQAYAEATQELPPDREPRPGHVRLQTLRAPDSAGMKERVHEEFRELFLGDLLRRREPRDIAVLVRSNDEANELAELLVGLGAPVVTENSLLLAEHPVIRQTVACLRFLDYPEDTLALWDVLTGGGLPPSWLRLDPSELDSWLVDQKAPGLLERLYERFPLLRELIQPFRRGAGLMRPYDLVQELWRFGRVFERHAPDELYLRRFLEIVHVAETEGCQSLSAFLEFWNASGVDEKVPLPESMNAVSILTIHKAKGLQFPVVVVPSLQFSDPFRDRLTAWRPDETFDQDLLVPLKPELDEAFLQEGLPLALEALNLLYVAWTRPEDELYVFVTLRDSHPSNFQKALRVLVEDYGLDVAKASDDDSDGAVNADAFDDEDTNNVEDADGAKSAHSRDPVYEQGPRPEIPDEPWLPPAMEKAVETPEPPPAEPFQPMAWLPELRIYRSALETEEFNERRRGALAHRCMEYASRVPAGLDVAEAARLAVRLGLEGHVDPHDPASFGMLSEDLRADLAELAEWAMRDPEIGACIRHGRPELEIVDEQGEAHRADLFIEEPGGFAILEYKTGAARPEHASQLRRYLRLVRALPGNEAKNGRGLLVYLDQRRVERVELGGAS